MGRLSDWLKNGPIVADGAWGTEFQKRGLPLGRASDLWNLSRPEEIVALARRYAQAGARVVTTNTFQANPLSLGSGEDAPLVNRTGVELARAGAPGLLVFGSMGPTGRLGEVGAAAGSRAFRAQAEALSAADALLLETQFDLEEALLGLAEARATGLPVVVSLSFGPDGTLKGAAPETAAKTLADAGADAVGANCGDGPDAFPELCRRLRSATGLPVWARPNAGLPTVHDGRATYSIGPDAFGAAWASLTAAGASFVGGCCGAGPEHVRALAEAAGLTGDRGGCVNGPSLV